jgi:hypothetical protein
MAFRPARAKFPILPREDAEDEIVVPFVANQSTLALAAVVTKAAAAVAGKGALVVVEHAQVDAVQSEDLKPKGEHKPRDLCAEAAAETPRVEDADDEPGASVVGPERSSASALARQRNIIFSKMARPLTFSLTPLRSTVSSRSASKS